MVSIDALKKAKKGLFHIYLLKVHDAPDDDGRGHIW